jgi:hypothetical protein
MLLQLPRNFIYVISFNKDNNGPKSLVFQCLFKYLLYYPHGQILASLAKIKFWPKIWTGQKNSEANIENQAN